MTTSPPSDSGRAQHEDLPDRMCTWCHVPMHKRLVGGGLYIHYTCPKCVFQHATKRSPAV